jgi:3-hydroxybutyryl-CoA dehydrogenase
MNIGVIGFGVMGEGLINYLSAFQDIKKIYLKTGNKKKFDKKIFEKKLKINCRLMKKNFVEELTNKIICIDEFDEFNECSIVIESIVENFQIKSNLLSDLSKQLNSNIIISSNTSSLTQKQLIMNVKHPNRFCCVHFFNPLWSTEYVEFIINEDFNEQLSKNLFNFIKIIEKKIIQVKDVNGFAVNRILIPMINESIKLVEEGVISKDDLNSIFEKNIGMPMGPLKLADFIGNDTVLSIIENLSDEKIQNIHISETLKKMVKENFLGDKSGKGFYSKKIR